MHQKSKAQIIYPKQVEIIHNTVFNSQMCLNGFLPLSYQVLQHRFVLLSNLPSYSTDQY